MDDIDLSIYELPLSTRTRNVLRKNRIKTLRDLAPTGSGAERLFKAGNPETAPAGRPDDFAAP